MEQEFSKAEQTLIMEILRRHEESLIDQVARSIAQTEADANAEFAARGLTFSQHSPANADYLSAVVFGKLFDSLHRGNRALAERILTMEAKRAGISLHVE